MSDLKNVKPLDDFNWDEFENGGNANVSKEDLEKAYDETLNKVSEHQVVEGTVIAADKKEVIVNIGYKSDGIIPASEFRYNPDLKVGDKVEVYVENQEDAKGQLVLSHKKARLSKSWERVNAALDNEEVIQGYIKCRTKGGMIVDVFGIEAFLPGSQIDVHRVSDPHEVVSLDQKINVVILDFDEEKKRIALGLKQLTPHPWDALDANLKVGDHVKGKVVVMADYGAFVEIAPGVEGLIHVSEMSWSQHLRSAQDFMKVGDEVEAVILTLDRAERKMSLGIKQLKEDPWETIEVKYPVGSKHTAKVRNFTNFGIFVELEEGVDGLIHISDLSWTKKVKHPSEFTTVGAPIDVVVLEIDKENRRLSLGHKQLEKNPWDEYEAIYTPGSVHKGTITELMDKGAVITLAEGGEGFATPKHLVKEDGSQAKKGEELDFKVIEFVKETKRIILSHSRTFEEGKDDVKTTAPRKHNNGGARKNEAAAINNVAAGTSLGDIDALAKLKAQMEGKA